jgi:hypothetical protein
MARFRNILYIYFHGSRNTYLRALIGISHYAQPKPRLGLIRTGPMESKCSRYYHEYALNLEQRMFWRQSQISVSCYLVRILRVASHPISARRVFAQSRPSFRTRIQWKMHPPIVLVPSSGIACRWNRAPFTILYSSNPRTHSHNQHTEHFR